LYCHLLETLLQALHNPRSPSNEANIKTIIHKIIQLLTATLISNPSVSKNYVDEYRKLQRFQHISERPQSLRPPQLERREEWTTRNHALAGHPSPTSRSETLRSDKIYPIKSAA
jgi:DNA-directed RNA polymerase specialized sigma24 family protein